MIQVAIADIRTYAMVDTGGVYLLCPPQYADLIDLNGREPLEEAVTMLVPRYGRLEGDLHRVPLKLLAVEGSGLELSATAFVPRTPDGQPLPLRFPIMGLQGCLERLRFAVDPYDDTFYFGTIGEEGSV